MIYQIYNKLNHAFIPKLTCGTSVWKTNEIFACGSSGTSPIKLPKLLLLYIDCFARWVEHYAMPNQRPDELLLIEKLLGYTR